MLYFTMESSNPEIEVSFNCIDNEDKYDAIIEKMFDFVENKIGDCFYESLGAGFMAKSDKYTVVILENIIRINYFINNEDILFQHIDMNLKAGVAFYNIEEFPPELEQLCNDIFDIANS